jgi:DNA processing protein
VTGMPAAGPDQAPLAGPDRDAYLALALVPGIGHARLRALLAACETAIGAFGAPIAFLQSVAGIGPTTARAIRACDPSAGARAREAAAALGGSVLLPGDPEFPAALLTIHDPPAALFAVGRTGLVGRPVVAIVGSRDHTAYGAEVCRGLAFAAAEAGVVVASGMARGLDAVAHRAALDGGGGTIGVLGNGLGVVYPAANRGLYEAVARDGLLLTEGPPGERPNAGSFQVRNRLIAGLAAATVVVEAAPGSGALITAAAALEEGREVCAVPGPVTSRTSVGPNRLLRDGARPLLEPADLLSLYPGVGARRDAAPQPDATRARLLQLLRGGPRHVDDLARALGAEPGALLGYLGALEIDGLVVQQPGQRFARPGGGWAAAGD